MPPQRVIRHQHFGKTARLPSRAMVDELAGRMVRLSQIILRTPDRHAVFVLGVGIEQTVDRDTDEAIRPRTPSPIVREGRLDPEQPTAR